MCRAFRCAIIAGPNCFKNCHARNWDCDKKAGNAVTCSQVLRSRCSKAEELSSRTGSKKVTGGWVTEKAVQGFQVQEEALAARQRVRVVAEVEAAPGVFAPWATYHLVLDAPEVAGAGSSVSVPAPDGKGEPVVGTRRKLQARAVKDRSDLPTHVARHKYATRLHTKWQQDRENKWSHIKFWQYKPITIRYEGSVHEVEQSWEV